MAASPGAMQLCTLQTIEGLGPTASDTVVLAVPVDILQAVSGVSDFLKSRSQPTEIQAAPSDGA